MNKLLSVIIPVYNVEDYLRRCVDSVLNQSYKDIEVILVDDGSDDNSGNICDEYGDCDDRVLVFHVENGGLGSARNIGLDHCTGDLVTFVDADDFIDYNTYSANISYFVNDPDLDMLQYPYCRYSKGSIVRNFITEERIETDKKKIYRDAYEKGLLKSYMPNKIFRRKIFENIRFNENIFFEDREILPILIERVVKLVYSDSGMYYYSVRTGQITENYRTPKHLSSEISAYLSIIRTIKNYNSLYDIVLKLFAECLYCSNAGDKVLWEEIMLNKPALVKSLFSKAPIGYKLMAIKSKFFPSLLK